MSNLITERMMAETFDIMSNLITERMMAETF